MNDIKQTTKCDFEDCPGMPNGGIILRNDPDSIRFPEMGEDQQMHLECYIRLCIRKYLEEEIQRDE